MTASARRVGPLLPRGEAHTGTLAFVVAVLCFIACLAGVASIAASRAAEGWARDLRGEATVQVRPRADQTPDQAAARAAEVLSGTPGVAEARALEPERAKALLRPWLGEGILDDLPIPRLVTVRLEKDRPADAARLGRALSQAGLDADVDDHALWLADVERAARLATTTGIAVFLLTAAAAAAAVAFATRAGLLVRRDLLAILHLSGATEAYVAGVFQARFAVVAGLAGLYGALAAAGVIAVLRLAGGSRGFTPALPVDWADLLALLPCPLLAATVGGIAARWVTLRLLREDR